MIEENHGLSGRYPAEAGSGCQPSASAPDGSSQSGIPNARGPWRKAEFAIQIRGQREAQTIHVEGLVDGIFGLDRRKCYDFGNRRSGYVVTHLATGYGVRHLACSLNDAKKVVALLHEADWTLTDPQSAGEDPGRIEAVRAVDRLGFSIAASELEPAQAIEARRAATAETGAVHESAVGNADAPKATS